MRKPKQRQTKPRQSKQRKPNDLSRSLAALDLDRTLIAVIEMGASSWLVAGLVPGVDAPVIGQGFTVRSPGQRDGAIVTTSILSGLHHTHAPI